MDAFKSDKGNYCHIAEMNFNGSLENVIKTRVKAQQDPEKDLLFSD